jgi:pimeloyl-ACP methyl ester carboxylesterase
MSKVIVMGHSMGGSVTLNTGLADKDNKIAAIVCVDPHISICLPDGNIEADYNMSNKAIHVLETEGFAPPLYSNDPFNKRVEFIRVHSMKSNQEWHSFKEQGHDHMTDLSHLSPEQNQVAYGCNALPLTGWEYGLQVQMYALAEVNFLRKNGLCYPDSSDQAKIDAVMNPRMHLLEPVKVLAEGDVEMKNMKNDSAAAPLVVEDA